MSTTKYILTALFLLTALLMAMPSASALSVYNYQIYSPDIGNESVFLRAPANSSSVGVNTSIIVTVYTNASNISLQGWNVKLALSPGNMSDFSVPTGYRTNTLSLMRDNETLLTLVYHMVDYIVTANDPNLQPVVDNEVNKVREENAPPTIWLWSPFTWGSAILGAVLIFSILGFFFTRTTLLIEWMNQANVIFLGIILLANIVSFAYMIFFTGDTAVDSLLGFAYMSLRFLILSAISTGWFAGVAFARYSLNLQKYLKVDLHNKVVSEISGVEYEIKGKKYWAHQTLWDAINRIWKDIHTEITYRYDRGIAKKFWTYVTEFGSTKMTFINDFLSDRVKNTVMLDMSGDILVKASFKAMEPLLDKYNKEVLGKDGKPALKSVHKTVVVEADFSNIARVVGCELPSNLPRDLDEHCKVEDAIIHANQLLMDTNRKLTQEIQLVKNKEAKKWGLAINDNLLDLQFGRSKPDQRAPGGDLMQEVERLKKENETAREKLAKQEKRQLSYETFNPDASEEEDDPTLKA